MTIPLSHVHVSAEPVEAQLIDAEIDSVPAPAEPLAGASRSRLLLGISLVLIAFNLRAIFSSASALLPEIRTEFGLSAVGASILTTLPVICLGLFSPLAPRLAQRLGAERTLMGVLVLLMLGTAMRGLGWIPAAVSRHGAGRRLHCGRQCAAARPRQARLSGSGGADDRVLHDGTLRECGRRRRADLAGGASLRRLDGCSPCRLGGSGAGDRAAMAAAGFFGQGRETPYRLPGRGIVARSAGLESHAVHGAAIGARLLRLRLAGADPARKGA